jgi:hypothetical protein
MDQKRELIKVVISLYTRQLAMQDLLRYSGVTQNQMNEALSRAKKRVSNVPRLAHPSSSQALDLQGLSGLLESIRWPFEA